jgi:predicted transcriptional regulator
MKTLAVQVPVSLSDEMKAQATELERGNYREAIREGLEDVDAGHTVSMEAMDQWLDSLDTSSEQPAPKAGIFG